MISGKEKSPKIYISRKIVFLIFFVVSILTLLTISRFIKYPLFFLPEAYYRPTVTPAILQKSCSPDNPGFDSKRSPKCEFYEGCVHNFCVYDFNWAQHITSQEALVIYERLKGDVGIDIPLILDKDRVSRLLDGGVGLIARDDPCAFQSFDQASYFACWQLRETNSEYKETTDKMTLTSILKGMYPGVSNYDIEILANKLREINGRKLPRAGLEQVLLALDVYTMPFLVKDTFTFGIRGITKTGKLLPKLLGLSKTTQELTLTSEGAGALREIAQSQGGGRVLDFTTQMRAYLKTQTPTKIINPNGQRVNLYRSKMVLSPEKWAQFSDMLADVFSRLSKMTDTVWDPGHVYFVEDISVIAGSRSAAGYYLDDYGIYVLDASTAQYGVNDLVGIALHEKIHRVLSQKGIAQYISGLARSEREFWNFRAFEEGLTEYFTQYIMKRAGYTGAYVAYGQQVEAVNALFGYGKWDYLIPSIVRHGNFDFFFSVYNWTRNDLINWILRLVSPVSFIRNTAVNILPDVEVQARNTTYNSNIPLNQDSSVEYNAINTAAYTLVDEAVRIMQDSKKTSISFENLDNLKSALLAASIINDVDSKGVATIADVKKVLIDLGSYTSYTYQRSEYDEDLPPIGDGKIHNPANISNIPSSPTPLTTSTPFPTTVRKNIPVPTTRYNYPTNTPVPTPVSFKSAIKLDCSTDNILEILSGPKNYGNTDRLYVNARVANGVKSKNPDGTAAECYAALKNCECQGTSADTTDCLVGDRCVLFIP